MLADAEAFVLLFVRELPDRFGDQPGIATSKKRTRVNPFLRLADEVTCNIACQTLVWFLSRLVGVVLLPLCFLAQCRSIQKKEKEDEDEKSAEKKEKIEILIL